MLKSPQMTVKSVKMASLRLPTITGVELGIGVGFGVGFGFGVEVRMGLGAW